MQIKLNGYRVELSEIEEVLNAQPQVAASCAVPVRRGDTITCIRAFVVPATGVETNRELAREFKRVASEKLATYMVPRTIKFLDELPVNSNGKTDRKALEQL